MQQNYIAGTYCIKPIIYSTTITETPKHQVNLVEILVESKILSHLEKAHYTPLKLRNQNHEPI